MARTLQFVPRAVLQQAKQATGFNPMRVLTSMSCVDCGQQWTQPAASGNCPICHSPRTVAGEQRVSHAERV